MGKAWSSKERYKVIKLLDETATNIPNADNNVNKLNSGKGIQVEINGDLFNCNLIKEPLYDPSGSKMRS